MSDKRMGEVFAQDKYPQPLQKRGRLADTYDDLAKLYAERVDPTGQISGDAGLRDIGKWQYGPPKPYFKLAPWQQEHASDMRAFQGMANMINPERFNAAQQSWPESPNAIWSFDDRFRGM
jgi:hypothetical protein